MSTITVRPYKEHSIGSVTGLLQATLPLENITEANFTRKVLLDPNFEPSGAFVATEQGRLAGFALAIRRRHILEDGPDDRDRGWITLFAVSEASRRRGVGTALFDAAEIWLRDQGCVSVAISPYAPNYWTPGVDEAAYPAALAFLEQRGYETVSRPLSMAAALDGWQTPEWIQMRAKQVYTCRFVTFKPEWNLLRLTAFLREEFPGDWQRYVRETMLGIVNGQRSEEDLLVAYEKAKVIGFAQCEGERFGPFGVAKEFRGQGIGAVLLYEMLELMKRRGLHKAWFLWTDDVTADRLYKPAGFCETRRYRVLRRMLR